MSLTKHENSPCACINKDTLINSLQEICF